MVWKISCFGTNWTLWAVALRLTVLSQSRDLPILRFEFVASPQVSSKQNKTVDLLVDLEFHFPSLTLYAPSPCWIACFTLPGLLCRNIMSFMSTQTLSHRRRCRHHRGKIRYSASATNWCVTIHLHRMLTCCSKQNTSIFDKWNDKLSSKRSARVRQSQQRKYLHHSVTSDSRRRIIDLPPPSRVVVQIMCWRAATVLRLTMLWLHKVLTSLTPSSSRCIWIYAWMNNSNRCNALNKHNEFLPFIHRRHFQIINRFFFLCYMCRTASELSPIAPIPVSSLRAVPVYHNAFSKSRSNKSSRTSSTNNFVSLLGVKRNW